MIAESIPLITNHTPKRHHILTLAQPSGDRRLLEAGVLTTQHNLHEVAEFQDLIKAAEIEAKYHWEWNRTVVMMWGVVVPPGSAIYPHNHSLSGDLVGVYYLTDGVPTKIRTDDRSRFKLCGGTEGDMVMMDSYHEHQVEPHEGEGNRITVAFVLKQWGVEGI